MEKMAHLLSLWNSKKNWVKRISSFSMSPNNIILLFILSLASFLRLHRISEYMTFLGDEGRDVLVAKEILEGNLTLLGPRASAGDFFLGPVYYYMIAPFLWLFRYDPVGPAVMVALFGIATVLLVFLITRKFFGVSAGFSAAALYAVSPVIISYSRSSWNPNPVPFFSLLIIYLTYYGVKNKSLKLFFLIGILLGISFQLHYITTFLALIIFLFVLTGNWVMKTKGIIKAYFTQYFSIFLGFIVGFSPFIAFEIKHGFPNIRTIINFIFVDNFYGDKVTDLSHIEIVKDVFFRLYSRLLLNFPYPAQTFLSENPDLRILQIITYFVAGGSIVFLFLARKKLIALLLSLWLVGGLFLFGFYKREIYDYYYAFLFPVPFILTGNMIASLFRFRKKLRYAGIVLGSMVFGFLFYLLLSQHPFQYVPNKQKAQAEKIADFVIEKTENKPYNFALVTVGNSDHVFRYFFELKDRPPVTIENEKIDPRRVTVTEQLFVVCDSDCEPLGNALWEVAGFGPAEIKEKWNVSVVKVYKLVHPDS